MTDLDASLESLNSSDAAALLTNTNSDRIHPILGKSRLDIMDLALLLSPGATPLLEDMARRSGAITRARFGNTVTLYAPLYISNLCSGSCPYCGFNRLQPIQRISLTHEQVLAEAEVLKNNEIQHLLLVSGDGPEIPIADLCRLVSQLKSRFPGIAVEVPPLTEEDYGALLEAGVDGVTLYQETYHRPAYDEFHKDSPKADYTWRLYAMDRAGRAGMRRLNIGVLWGLTPWRMDALKLGVHARYLEKKYWQSQILIGMPRLHMVPDGFTIPAPMADRDFVQAIVALRLFLHDAGIVVSTRERPEFRDHLPALGVTQFSAGSRTRPGGYTGQVEGDAQFEIDDHRSPKAVQSALLQRGYDPVLKDWDRGFTRERHIQK